MKLTKQKSSLEALINPGSGLLLAQHDNRLWTVQSDLDPQAVRQALEKSQAGTISSEELSRLTVTLRGLGHDDLVYRQPVAQLKLSTLDAIPTKARARKPAKLGAGLVDPDSLSDEQLWGDWSA